MTKLTPQAIAVLRHIEECGSITQREAMLDHAIQCLAKRIQELRAAGYNIVTINKKHRMTKQRYARYVMG
jgi:hypothetical protein